MRRTAVRECATAMLARERARAMPLERLHRVILRKLGPVLSGPGELRDWLAQFPDSFLILDPPGGSADSVMLPDAIREAHEAALDQAGVTARPRVVLVNTKEADRGAADVPRIEPMAPLVERLGVSIRALSAVTADDPTLTDALAEALHEVRDLQHTLNPDQES